MADSVDENASLHVEGTDEKGVTDCHLVGGVYGLSISDMFESISSVKSFIRLTQELY